MRGKTHHTYSPLSKVFTAAFVNHKIPSSADKIVASTCASLVSIVTASSTSFLLVPQLKKSCWKLVMEHIDEMMTWSEARAVRNV